MVKFDKEIINEIQKSMGILKSYFNNLSINRCSLNFIEGRRTPFKRDIINFVFENIVAQQKEIIIDIQQREYNGKSIRNEQVGRKIKSLVNKNILIEIDHLDDDLKQYKQAKKSYTFNPFVFNFIDSINKISKDLGELKPLKLSGFANHIKFLIEGNHIHGFNEIDKKFIDIKTVPGKLVVHIQFVFECKKSRCIKESCKMICFKTIENIIFKLSDQKEYNRDLITVDNKKKNCVLTLKIQKR